jgi:hypothetical protein
MLCLYVLRPVLGIYCPLASVIFWETLLPALQFLQSKDTCSLWVPAASLSSFCALVLFPPIVYFLDNVTSTGVDTVTPTGVGQLKDFCVGLVSDEVLSCWKVAHETVLADIPTAAPIRTTADMAM